MGVIRNTLALVAVEAFAIFMLYLVCKYVFGIDIFDFSSPRGKWIGGGIVAVLLYSFYTVLFESKSLAQIGAYARYDPTDRRFQMATA